MIDNIFGSIQILWHEIRLLSFIFSIVVFLYFFITTKESLLVRFLSSALWVLTAHLLYEIPWYFGYFLFTGGIVRALDEIVFILGEILAIWTFSHLKRKGLNVPIVNISRWAIVMSLVSISVGCLIFSGFYPLWINYLNGMSVVDPHTVFPLNLEWLGGKAIGMLGWMWIANGGGRDVR